MGQLMKQDLLTLEVLQEELKDTKAKELEIRKKIINHFRYGTKVEGTQHKSIEDAGDIDIVIILKLNRKANKDALDAVWIDLTDEEKDCIKFVPEVKTKEYKALLKNKRMGKLINCITETPGLASVSLKYDE